MGESRQDRIGFIYQLATLPTPPESVPINQLIPIQGTPLQDVTEIDHFEFIRTIAVARIVLPTSHVRLSAGRENMPESVQALCFFAGANSLFYGEKLLTAGNQTADQDQLLMEKLKIRPEKMSAPATEATTES